MTNEEIRKVALKGDSILSLLWYRYIRPEIKNDPHISREFDEAITGLRRVQKALKGES